jgi:hypothetical protein
MHVVRCVVAVAALLVPALAGAEPRSHKPTRTARIQKSEAPAAGPRSLHACLKAPVEIVAGAESATIALAKCDGSVAPLAVEELSILARPDSAPKPKQPLYTLAESRGTNLAPGIRRVDARLVERLELVADHFRRPSQPTRFVLVSGYRPRSTGSFHSSGRALDFRLDGIPNEALVAFCKTLPDTGCGYYPNSVFVHMDVRNAGAGHITWIDASRPGEAPRYVSAWPPPEHELGLPSLPAVDADEPRDSIGTGPTRRDLAHTYFF